MTSSSNKSKWLLLNENLPPQVRTCSKKPSWNKHSSGSDLEHTIADQEGGEAPGKYWPRVWN